MNKEELENKIADQEEIIRLQKDKINELELKLFNQPYVPDYPRPEPYSPLPYVVDSGACVDGGLHEYPSPWFGTIPPHCTKCHKQAPNYGITFGGTGDPNFPNTFTTGDGSEPNIGITYTTGDGSEPNLGVSNFD